MTKQARTITMNVFNAVSLILLMTALAACTGSAGNSDGDVDGDIGLCGEHQHLEGGVCACDTGYVPGSDGCVTAPDGDSDVDSKDSDKDGNDDNTDGDNADGDNIDGDNADGDNTDGDAEPDEDQLCTCPIIDDEYCFDPEVPDAIYKRILVAPGSTPGCSLHMVIYDEFHAAFSGGLTCNEEGRAPVPAIGCVFTFDLVDEEVSLICGNDIFNFRHAWCSVPDGDDDAEVDGDTISDPDSDPEPDADGDAAEPDEDPDVNPDGDIADGDDDVIDSDVNFCDSHSDCPSSHFCYMIGQVCVPDVCNVALGQLCPLGFICDQWGQCIMGGADGDMTDGDINTDGDQTDGDGPISCGNDEECPEHYRCLTDICVLGCTSEMQCPPDTFCNFHGQCITIGGDEDSDYDFEAGCECKILNAETGEDTCGLGEYCNESCQCVWDCQEDNDCQVEFDCYCTDKGRCECPEPECDSDYACPTGEYCNLANVCQAGCPSVACPPGMYCKDDHGHCDAEVPDGDVDPDTSTSCNSDNECPVGYHCGAALTCTYVCQFNSQCDEGYVCDTYGRCVPDNIECTNHSECDAGYYCGSDNGCHQDCTTDDWCHDNYDATYSCNQYGFCEILPTDGDADSDGNTWPNCQQDSDCTQNAYYYCSAEKICTPGCNNSNQCDPGYYCSQYGRCEQLADWDPDEGQIAGWCDSDDDCPIDAGAYPSAQYCGSDNQCHFDCFYGAESSGCSADQYCDEEGRCQACGGDMDCGGSSTVYCDENGECAAGLHCVAAQDVFLCVTDCPCPSTSICTDDGYCEVPQTDADTDPDEDTDSDEPGVVCGGPIDCPLGTYCDLGLDTPECVVDCFHDTDCSAGFYCNCRGQCHANPDFNDCLPALSCTLQYQCPYSTPCESALGGQYCYTHCLPPAVGCEANQTCDSLTGYCVDVPVDGDEETDVDLDPETEPDEELFGCFVDVDCPSGMYCGIDSICASDCTPTRSMTACSEPAPDCEGAMMCTERGRCVAPATSCTIDDQCPMGSYCMTLAGLNQCFKGCSADIDCSSGKVCDTSHGKCVDDGSQDPDPTYPSCTTDCNCPVYSRCYNGYCITDCIYDRGCGVEEYCSFTGTCEVSPDGDVDVDVDGDADGTVDCKPNLSCTSDIYCPYHTKCNIADSRCEGYCTYDSHCQNGQVCSDDGECVTPPYIWDGNGHDLLTGCENDTECPKGTYCWAEGSVCRIDCVCGDPGQPDLLSCASGYTCDYDRGRCVSSGGK